MPASENKMLLNSRSNTSSNIVLALGLVIILATLIIPLPAFLLDLLLACSIAASILVLVITLSSREALELSSFPSLLLFVTLFRLSLNVASTRLILTEGTAGKIIQTFGGLVAGGSVVTGLVIFLILVIIQFVVITKGAERVSEVSARFTLDAMPGKQMAIDADLNAGAITEEQANERRKKIVKESEFYGAMDGSSKFIRGDAKAGLIITAVNIIGGIAIGYSKGMDLYTALKTYSILSIGDGLVSQIPSIIISISSGFLVTKISSSHSVGKDLSKQFLKTPQPLIIASIIVAAMAMVPGMPKIAFLVLAAGIGIVAKVSSKAILQNEEKTDKQAGTKAPQKPGFEELLESDRISVHVGVRLIGMVDPSKNHAFYDRIGSLRRRFAQEFGIIVPLVRLRDSITLKPTEYHIRFQDHTIATGQIEPDMFLAMNPGSVDASIDGITTTEPVYGLPALWVSGENREKAELAGYTVIDSESVFITHLSEILKKNLHELLTREDVQELIECLRKKQPSLVGEVVGDLVPAGLLQRILRNLLEAGIPVRQLTTILEMLGDHATKTKNPEMLTELVRKALSRTITEMCLDQTGKITAITFEPELEHQLVSTIRYEKDTATAAIPAETTLKISEQIAHIWKEVMDLGLEKCVLLCDANLRHHLAAILKKVIPQLPVIAYDEITPGTEIEPLSQTVSLQQMELAGA